MKNRPVCFGLAAAVIGLAMSAGCSGAQLSCDDCVSSVRNRHLAKCAWFERRDCYAGIQNCLCDFRRGFKDGYVAALEGRAECPPVLPPKSYWGVRYQSPDKRCCVAAWHDGWSHGAVAADQDGVANMGEIVLRCACGAGHADGQCRSISPIPAPMGVPLPVPAAVPPVSVDMPSLSPVPDAPVTSSPVEIDVL